MRNFKSEKGCQNTLGALLLIGMHQIKTPKTLSLSLFHSHTIKHTHTFFDSLSLFHPEPHTLCLSLSLSQYRSLYVSLFLSHPLSLFLRHYNTHKQFNIVAPSLNCCNHKIHLQVKKWKLQNGEHESKEMGLMGFRVIKNNS